MIVCSSEGVRIVIDDAMVADLPRQVLAFLVLFLTVFGRILFE